ncbi:MAG: DMT family transporter [Pseudomonadota bacterium]
MTPAHWILMILVNLAFGLNLAAVKVAMTEVPPLAFAALRFAVVLLVLAPVLKIHRGQMRVLVVVGLLMGTLHFAFITTGLAWAGDVSTVAIVIQLGVPFATLMSVVFLGEVIRWRRWLGISLAFFGVMVIGFDPRVFDYWQAVLMVALAALSAAAGMTLMKGKLKVDAFQLQGWLAVIAFPTLAVLSAFMEQEQMHAITNMSPLVVACLIFSALGATLLGHGGAYQLLRHYDLSLISPLLLLSTVFGVLFGVWLLDDLLTPKIVLGGVITLAGALLITLRNGEKGTATPLAQTTIPATKR